MPFFPKNFRIPRPISFFLAKKNFRASREKGPQKLNSGNKYGGERRFPTPPPSAGTPLFSLESVTLVAEKQGNSAFKNIPHLFSVKLVAKPRYATFLKKCAYNCTLFLQPNYVMERMECKLAPQAHGTLLFSLPLSFFLTPHCFPKVLAKPRYATFL